MIVTGLYLVVTFAFFIVHHLITLEIFDTLRLTSRFSYSVVTEFLYVYKVMIPIGFIYSSYKLFFNEKAFDRTVITLSAVISIPLVVANIFAFGPSTYEGTTQAPFFTWFFGIYEEFQTSLFGISFDFAEKFHPRMLATQFWFKEGNTTGILLFMLLPLLYYVFSKTDNKKLIPLIFIQGLAMFVISTRVATYGLLLISAAILVGWLFFVALKQIKFSKTFILTVLSVLVVFGGIYQYTPAYVNMQLDRENDSYVFEDEDILQGGRDILSNAPDLDPESQAFRDYYTFMFKEYAFLISSIPKQYYLKYYDYREDPKFWVDVIFEYDLYERVNGRQFQTIFFNYKMLDLTPKQKLFGFGYTRFMNGSIVLERDFVMHKYTFGPIGAVLFFAPWLLAIAAVVILFLKNFKKMFNFELMCIAMALFGGLGAAYISGHVMDQFATSIFMAWLLGWILRKSVLINKEEL
jgi:hypothetical protein